MDRMNNTWLCTLVQLYLYFVLYIKFWGGRVFCHTVFRMVLFKSPVMKYLVFLFLLLLLFYFYHFQMTSHLCGNTENKVVLLILLSLLILLLLLLLLFSLSVSSILELQSLVVSFAASDSSSALSVIPGVNFQADREGVAKGIGGGGRAIIWGRRLTEERLLFEKIRYV